MYLLKTIYVAILFTCLLLYSCCDNDNNTNTNDCRLFITVTPMDKQTKKPGDEYSYIIQVTKNDTIGDPIPNVIIGIEDDAILASIDGVITDVNGKATYNNILPINKTQGIYDIRFWAVEKDNCSQSDIETRQVEVVDDGQCILEVNVYPQSQNVSGGDFYSFNVKVTSQGMPVEGAKVSNTLPWGPSYSGTTGADGIPKPEIKDWRVPGDQTGGDYQICFTASKSGCTTGSGCATLIVSDPCELILDCTCPPENEKVGDNHTIFFTAKDQNTGQPVSGVTITLTNLKWLGIDPIYLTTGDEGKASYTGTVPQGEEGKTGTYTYYASKDGCKSTTINRCYINVSE